jgi:hypothetical protein
MNTPFDNSPARALLGSTTLGALLKPQHVVTIKESASADQALRVSPSSCAHSLFLTLCGRTDSNLGGLIVIFYVLCRF